MSPPPPISVLFSQALKAAATASNQSPFEDSTQELVKSSLADLTTLATRIVGLSLFSPNETLEDISTRDLVYLLVPYAIAEAFNRVRVQDPLEDIAKVKQSQRHLAKFISSLEEYEIVSDAERTLHARDPGTIKDPASRRELKIKQYQQEKELRGRIQAIRKQRGQLPAEGASESDLDLIASLLPAPNTSAEDEEEEDESEALRETTLLLLRLCYVQAQSQLISFTRQLEMLEKFASAPPRRRRDRHQNRIVHRESNAKTTCGGWTVRCGLEDRTARARFSMSRTGSASNFTLVPTLTQLQPLRPFTLLPSGAADRARLSAQVFGPSHRLPTMTVDELLEIEQAQGKFISGGGLASENQLTSSEQLDLDAQQDGTRAGAEKEEEKRLKDEKWAQFTDENPRGAGNTMNRG
ncbi:Serine/threonine protein phosphatase PP2A-associated protein [Mycena kentingensis (nom. inval.)]|nr:Serine/threonine protein phosphatase PP2A-associated protein [Mycena kentingensis (nom. inval.)]